jgi:hypothetical protein
MHGFCTFNASVFDLVSKNGSFITMQVSGDLVSKNGSFITMQVLGDFVFKNGSFITCKFWVIWSPKTVLSLPCAGRVFRAEARKARKVWRFLDGFKQRHASNFSSGADSTVSPLFHPSITPQKFF